VSFDVAFESYFFDDIAVLASVGFDKINITITENSVEPSRLGVV